MPSLDFESTLRKQLRIAPEDTKFGFWINNEGRIMLAVGSDEWVVVENRVIEWHPVVSAR